MALITKPDMEFIWASGGAIVEPSDVKKQTGWTPEVPPHQWENWLQNRQDQMLAHINQRGIPAWDGITEYEAGGLSYVQGSNGTLYKSVAASGPATTVQDPTSDVADTYWAVAFEEVDFLNSEIATVAAASTISLTFHAPDTSQIVISGSASITAFLVEEGRAFFVEFSGVNTLVNSASLVTNSGANILTAAGDSCVLRATAANTVEVLMFTKGIQPQSLTSNGYKIHADGTATPLIEQWGRFVQAPATTGNITVTFPIPFPNECFGVTFGEYSGPAPNWISTNGLPTTTGFVAGSVTPDQGYMWFAKGR